MAKKQEGKIKKHLIKTSVTTQYRKNTWGLERVVIDTLSNQLPNDSNGTKTEVFLKQKEIFVSLDDADKNVSTTEVVFKDDGSGYHYRLLSKLYSTKGMSSDTVGQFGEGAKLAVVAAIRDGIAIEYESRNWTAKPKLAQKQVKIADKTTKRIEKKTVEQLCFEVEEKGKKKSDTIEGSRTRFTNPTPKFMDEIFKIPQNFLYFNREYKVLYTDKTFGGKLYDHRIIDLYPNLEEKERKEWDNAIFVKGVRVQYEKALFSYDLKITTLSQDRKSIPYDNLLTHIKNILTSCTDTSIIEKILTAANKNKTDHTVEFVALGFTNQYDLQNQRFTNARKILMDNDFIDEKIENSSKESPFALRAYFFDLSGSMNAGKSISDYSPSDSISKMVEKNPGSIEELKKVIGSLSKQIPTDYSEILNDRSPIKKIRNTSAQIIHPKKVEENLWVKTFYSVFSVDGKKPVLESSDAAVNEDAKSMGYIPIKLNDQVKKYLIELNVETADDVTAHLSKEHKWLTIDDLTETEKGIVTKAEKIAKILGYTIPVHLRIYEGLFLENGRELPSLPSLNKEEKIHELTYSQHIGIRRNELTSLKHVTDLYIGELSALAANNTQYSRNAVNFLTKTLVYVAGKKEKRIK